MSTDNIEKLYRNFGVLADAKENASQHEEEYHEILAAVKGSPNEKRLASQFITRFFKYFPDLATKSIDALMDLCEDDDISIRKQAIKDLPLICRDAKAYVTKIADILAQLLQADDPTELSAVHASLIAVVKIGAKGALKGIFTQVSSGDEIVRERCLKFLNNKIRTFGSDIITKEAEDYIIEETKKVLQDVSADEFHLLMGVLAATRLGHTVSGQQEMVDIVAEQAELDQPYDATDPESVDRLVQCVRQSLPYFSSQVNSTRFVAYLCDHVLPSIGNSALDEGPLEIYKLLAELSINCGPLDKPEEKVNAVYNRLIEYMPLPPEIVDDADLEPNFDFSCIECMMFTLHQLGRQAKDYLQSDPERLRDFRLRLQYCARGTQGYVRKLRETLQGKTTDELKSEENKVKLIALKTTSNINTLIKELFHTPPSYKALVSLSWKPSAGTALSGAHNSLLESQKRHTPITFDSSPSKQSKTDRVIYQPPSGKYSNKVSSYVPGTRGGRGGGRGRRWNRGSVRGGNGRFRRSY